MYDKNDREIFEGSRIVYTPKTQRAYPNKIELYIVKFGEGSYDGGFYKFIGFYLELCNKDGSECDDRNNENDDGTANILFRKNEIEVID